METDPSHSQMDKWIVNDPSSFSYQPVYPHQFEMLLLTFAEFLCMCVCVCVCVWMLFSFINSWAIITLRLYILFLYHYYFFEKDILLAHLSR